MKHTLISAVLAFSFLIPAAAFADSTVSISLLGANPQTVYAGNSYVEPGFTAVSSTDGDITDSVIASFVNMSVPGWTDRQYIVTDSTGADASADRSIDVLGTGGAMPFCSGPSAPGWNVSLPGGGCGSAFTFVAYQKPDGDGTTCQFFNGCEVPNK